MTERRLRAKLAGSPVTLAGEIARGGEGVVYSVAERTDTAAKIYLQKPDPSKCEKLELMARHAGPELLKVSAWPTDVVVDAGGETVGFLMPRIGSRADAHQLYSPKSRLNAFPEADFRFLVHVAGNIARAFATVHSAGHVVGDINHGHMLVGADGRVVLIDADSFQVELGGKKYLCDVGVPLFTAPELQGHPFRGLHRTQNSDLFGMAVMLFQVLMLGRHPFAGVWNGIGEMPIERAIKEGRFAYGATAESNGMKRPPNTIPMETLGPRISALFENAFDRETHGRPDAPTWVRSLGELKATLAQCAADPSHFAPSGGCPWCSLEKATGSRLFGRRNVSSSIPGHVDLATLWAAVQAAKPPSPDPPAFWNHPWKPPPGVKVASILPKRIRQWSAAGLALSGLYGCGSFGGDSVADWISAILVTGSPLVWPWPPKSKIRVANDAVRQAHSRWSRLLSLWEREATRRCFDEQRRGLEVARSELTSLPAERARRMADLKANQRNFQRDRYLDRFAIAKGRIPGIGPGRKATLASFGIETAADVSSRAITRVPGFGRSLTAALLTWRDSHEANFRFNPNEPVDPGEIQRVNSELAEKQKALIATIRSGVPKLRALPGRIEARREKLAPLMREAWDALKVAEADRRAL